MHADDEVQRYVAIPRRLVDTSRSNLFSYREHPRCGCCRFCLRPV